MAVVAGIKIKNKAPKKDPSWVADEKHMGGEPVWDYERALEMPDEQYNHFLTHSLNYYNYFFTVKDLKKHVVEFLQNYPKEFSNSDIGRYLKSADDKTPMTVCSLVKAHSVGMPLRERQRDYIVEKVRNAISTIDEDVVEKTVGGKDFYVPTIQDRINEKMSVVIGEIEGQIDFVITKKDPTLKIYDFLTVSKVPQASVGKIRTVIEKKKAEMVEVKTDKDQLKEAYSFMSKKEIDSTIAYYDSIINDLDQYAQVKKAQKKVRVAKAPSKDKVVSKLKFMVEDKVLKMVSISPAAIVGATELYIFNTKTRKFGRYIADSHSGSLGVKGTTIVGYDEAKSICKTLRKPEEQLKEFMSAGKVQLRKFLDNIKAVDTKLNGRISTDILLLKAV